MEDETDITDYEAIVAEVVGDWASKVVGESVVVPNFVVVCDGRMVNGGDVCVVLEPEGSPTWIIQALIERGQMIAEEGIGFLGRGGERDGDDDE